MSRKTPAQQNKQVTKPSEAKATNITTKIAPHDKDLGIMGVATNSGSFLWHRSLL